MRSLLVLACGVLLPACQASVSRGQGSGRPSLVVFIAIDQLRPEYLETYSSQFSGGLARLMAEGAVFSRGLQDHAITETAPGHAAMLSGRFPRSSGISSNDAGVQDSAAPLLEVTLGSGASPHRFRGTALVDWLRSRDSRSRSLSVSRKDRSAILMMGNARTQVYWYSQDGRFTTSRYYGNALPSWVRAFNAKAPADRYLGATWDLLRPAADYAEPDSVLSEARGRDVVFPHRLPADTTGMRVELQNTPMMDELTLAFALRGVEELGLGRQPGRSDLLTISLSSTDAVGHRYGPDSREIHDQVLRVDQYLGSFLDSLYRMVDPSRVTIALTSDHGVAPFPDAGLTSRFRTVPGGVVDLRPVAMATLEGLTAAGIDRRAFLWDIEVLHLDPRLFQGTRVNRDSVARAYARAAMAVPGVLRADLVSDLSKADTTTDVIARRWIHHLDPSAPVAVVVTLQPFWSWVGVRQAKHGSPHDYDAMVPIIFAGAGIRPGRHAEPVRVVDIAPTLAAVLGVRPAGAIDGRVIRSALR